MKRLLPLLALAVLMSACVKPTEHKDLKFSVLGDSFSSLEGTVDPETNDVFHYDNIGVTSPEQMWWHKVATEMEWTLDKNNSFSGSLMCNFDDFGAGAYYGPYSFLRRMDHLGNPDVIFVFGGTNDLWQGAALGEYVYSDWTEEQLEQVRPALAYMFESLKLLYPKAEVYFMIDMKICSGGVDEETKQAFIESVHRIASHCGVNWVDIYGIHKNQWHPDVQGQEDIARQVIEVLEADFNV